MEPEQLAKLQHTNIVPIHSVHEFEGLHAICMPYFGRLMLVDLLADDTFGPPVDRDSLDERLRIAEQIVSGLSHAHARGIVHRDIKPANILVADDGTVLLLDLNLSDDVIARSSLTKRFRK